MSKSPKRESKAARSEAEKAMVDYIVDRFIYSGQHPDIFLPKLYAMLEQTVSET